MAIDFFFFFFSLAGTRLGHFCYYSCTYVVKLYLAFWLWLRRGEVLDGILSIPFWAPTPSLY